MPRNAAFRASNSDPGPWAKWRGSRHSRYIRFISKYVHLPRGAGASDPMKLMPWQKTFIEAFMAEDVSAACLVMGRGGGKSGLMAGLATAAGFLEDDQGAPVVPIVAASLGQARSSVYDSVVWAVQHEPDLADRSIVFSGIGTERILIPRTGGLVFPRSAEPNTLQGLDVYPLGFVDEVGHVEIETYNAVVMGRKRPGAKVLAAGTPGPDPESPLYHLRELFRTNQTPPSFLYREYSGEAGANIHDESNWKRANPSLYRGLPSIEFLRNAAVMTPEALFRTYHLAEFGVSGLDGWLGSDGRAIWDALEDPYSLVLGADTWVGIDVGIKRDSTAVCVVQYRADQPSKLHAVFKIWMPTKDEPVDLFAVMAYLRELTDRYRIGAISFDPRFFDVPAAMLADEGLKMVEIPQSLERMTPAIGDLYTLIRAGGMTHDRDAHAAQQILAAVPRLNERGFTLSKNKSRERIDSAIALALAVDRATHKSKPRAKLVVL